MNLGWKLTIPLSLRSLLRLGEPPCLRLGEPPCLRLLPPFMSGCLRCCEGAASALEVGAVTTGRVGLGVGALGGNGTSGGVLCT